MSSTSQPASPDLFPPGSFPAILAQAWSSARGCHDASAVAALCLVESLVISCQLGCHILAKVKMLYSNGGAWLTSLFPIEAEERINIFV